MPALLRNITPFIGSTDGFGPQPSTHIEPTLEFGFVVLS